jgi:integrase
MNLPPGVTPYKDRHGKTRYRFRGKGLPAQDIPGEPGTDEFDDAARRAASGIDRRGKSAPAASARTLRAAWLEVTCLSEWRKLKGVTKAAQTAVAERFLNERINSREKPTFGSVPIASLRRGDVKKILARYSDRPHAGEAVIRMLRKVCLVALDNEWIEADPTFRVKYRADVVGHRAWTDAEMAQFEQRWPLGTRARLGYALALYTGQRRSDVAAMGVDAYNGQGIAVTQEKTGAALWIPAHPALIEAIEATPRSGPWLVCTTFGTRLTRESFGNDMADAIAAAGLPDDCRLHGLRKSAGRCLAEAGCSAHMIMAVLGHKTLAMAQKYTDAARQKMLAQQGMDLWAKPKFTIVSGGK